MGARSLKSSAHMSVTGVHHAGVLPGGEQSSGNLQISEGHWGLLLGSVRQAPSLRRAGSDLREPSPFSGRSCGPCPQSCPELSRSEVSRDTDSEPKALQPGKRASPRGSTEPKVTGSNPVGRAGDEPARSDISAGRLAEAWFVAWVSLEARRRRSSPLASGHEARSRAMSRAPAPCGACATGASDVLDTSVVIDFLLADGVAGEVEELLVREGTAAAPDLVVFEVLAVLRGDVSRQMLEPVRARGAIDDLGDLPVELFGTLPLRRRAWELRENLTAANALFVALAEYLGEPLATKDGGLAAAAREQAGIELFDIARRTSPFRTKGQRFRIPSGALKGLHKETFRVAGAKRRDIFSSFFSRSCGSAPVQNRRCRVAPPTPPAQGEAGPWISYIRLEAGGACSTRKRCCLRSSMTIRMASQSMSLKLCIGQYFGPHIEQNSALLK